jgi:hypothetical protein
MQRTHTDTGRRPHRRDHHRTYPPPQPLRCRSSPQDHPRRTRVQGFPYSPRCPLREAIRGCQESPCPEGSFQSDMFLLDAHTFYRKRTKKLQRPSRCTILCPCAFIRLYRCSESSACIYDYEHRNIIYSVWRFPCPIRLLLHWDVGCAVLKGERRGLRPRGDAVAAASWSGRALQVANILRH